MRKELQAHLSAHQQMLAGYTDYIKRHTHVLLQLVLNDPQVSFCRPCKVFPQWPYISIGCTSNGVGGFKSADWAV